MRQRIPALAFVCLLLALVLGACGAQQAPSEQPSEEAPAEEVAAVEPARASGVATPEITQSLRQLSSIEGVGEAAEAEGDQASDGLSLTLEVPDTIEAFVPEGMERATVGSDDRITVYDTSVYPFSAIAYMVVHMGCGCDITGTGFMVSRKVLLTAGHCLCCTEHHQAATNIDFYFGYQTDGSYYYLYDGPTSYVYGTTFPGGYSAEDQRWDYGIVRFNQNVGEEVGWLGMEVLSDSEFRQGRFTIAGYRDGVLKYDTDTASIWNKELIWTYIDTARGNSGAPVFRGESASAINIAEQQDGSKNAARRITNDIFDKVCSMDSTVPRRRDNGGGKDPVPHGQIDSDEDEDEWVSWDEDDDDYWFDDDEDEWESWDDDDDPLVVDPDDTGAAGFVLPYSATHRYTKKELSSLDNWGLYIARNEIYARHDYIFKTKDLKKYFKKKSWYTPRLTYDDFARIEARYGSILNGCELENVDTILDIEYSRGSKYAP